MRKATIRRSRVDVAPFVERVYVQDVHAARRALASAPVACPECGGPLDIDPVCVIDEPVAKADGTIGRRKKVAPAALCSGCEFCIEIENHRRKR